VYSPLESLVLEYASAMTSTPGCGIDQLTTRLREHFTEKQPVELTAAIAFENYRARFNAAMSIPAEGYEFRSWRPT
jgi:alkylhydroperoxidase family enzyme